MENNTIMNSAVADAASVLRGDEPVEQTQQKTLPANFTTGMIMDDAADTSTETEQTPEQREVAKHAITGEQLERLLRAQRKRPMIREYGKIGRNDPCPCGSGKKYKNCCLSEGKYERLKAV